MNNLVQSIYIVVAAAVMLCIHPDHPADKSVRFMSLAAFWCAGMFIFFMLLLRQTAMRNGPNGIVWGSFNPVWLCRIIYLREKLTWPSRIAFLLCIIGVILMSLKNQI